MNKQDEYSKQCQECIKDKTIIDNVIIVDGVILDEIESRDPEPYLPFVNRLKELKIDK